MAEHYQFVNPALPYGYDSLEPYIDTETMHLHHDKHLQAYTDNLNATLIKCPMLQSMSLEQLICISGTLPNEKAIPISRNAGGVYNHRFFFNGMSPKSNIEDANILYEFLVKAFGDYNAFVNKFKDAALSVFGSGYAWLVIDRCKKLSITTTSNQETPLTKCYIPILNIDVWEHAYYLKYQNRRKDYISNWFSVINWERAEINYLRALNGVT